MTESILLCARTACDKAAHPAGWNRMTHEMYCIECARLLNMTTPLNGGPLCPMLDTCDPVRGVATGSWGTTVLIDETKLRKPRG